MCAKIRGLGVNVLTKVDARAQIGVKRAKVGSTPRPVR